MWNGELPLTSLPVSRLLKSPQSSHYLRVKLKPQESSVAFQESGEVPEKMVFEDSKGLLPQHCMVARVNGAVDKVSVVTVLRKRFFWSFI